VGPELAEQASKKAAAELWISAVVAAVDVPAFSSSLSSISSGGDDG